MESVKEKYPVKLEDGIYVIMGQPKSDLLPKFLARNPKDNELFLLFGNNGKYFILKGYEGKKLRACHVITTERHKNFFAIGFGQDDFHGIITDPISTKHQKPTLRCGQTSVPLEVELFEIIG